MNIVAIDLDNVISETDVKIREIFRKAYGLNAKQEDITEFNYEDCLPITAEQARDALIEFHRYHLLSLRVVRGARSALKAIQSSFRVIIATDRPPETKEATMKWLRLRNIPIEDVIFVKDKEELLPMHIGWLVDDKWENAIKLANKGVRVILFDRPWNHKVSHKLIHRAQCWIGVVGALGLE